MYGKLTEICYLSIVNIATSYSDINVVLSELRVCVRGSLRGLLRLVPCPGAAQKNWKILR